MVLDCEKYMREALELAREAAAQGEVPVGCVVFDESGAVIGRGRNRREELPDAGAHAELEAISAACREKGLVLFVDGARLGTALACTDVGLPELARLTDVFYIGGTKLGALFGEAVVITNEALGRDFRYIIKQRGGMFAKGRLLGVMFETLMSDGLYERTGEREVALALRLRAAFEKKGWPLLYDSPTNQQFPIVPDAQLAKLAEKYSFSDWARVDETHRAVRFCTSWATKPADVDALIADIEAL